MDEYDIYYILKIIKSICHSVMLIFIVPTWGGAIRAGYQQNINELQERLFLFFFFF